MSDLVALRESDAGLVGKMGGRPVERLRGVFLRLPTIFRQMMMRAKIYHLHGLHSFQA
jgi:hypothetical protein